MSDPPEVTPQILELCGYIQVHQVLVGEGQSVSFNLTNGWSRVTLTEKDLGGSGSALGSAKQVTIWAAPGTKTERMWHYDLTIQVNDGEMLVVAMSNDPTLTGTGSLVALDPPTPMEMLAAQARVMGSGDGVEDLTRE